MTLGHGGRYTRGDGRGGFASGELGRQFRAAAYRAAGLPLPAAAPRTITLLTAVDGEEVGVSQPHVPMLRPGGRVWHAVRAMHKIKWNAVQTEPIVLLPAVGGENVLEV